MTRQFLLIFTLIFSVLLTTACEQETPFREQAPGPAVTKAGPSDEPPPTPPLKEDFDGEPTLSLFPRVGSFAPEEGDKEGQALWFTYIDHLLRISGPVKGKQGSGFAIRGIKTIDSVGFFSPLAVTPDTTYRVSFRAWSSLPKDGIAGAGIIEFDEFLWIAAQYPKSLSEKHYQRSEKGVQLTGNNEGTAQSFTFHTGPKTRMIHLVFFREGATSKEPFVIDDVEVTVAPKG